MPHNYIPSVEKGVRAQLERGIVAGYPVVDLRVTLVDGKAHSVDSSDAAFQTAGALALREAAEAGQVTLLEPVDEIVVRVPDAYVGAVMSDLSGRRGRPLGTEADERRRAQPGPGRGAGHRAGPVRGRAARDDVRAPARSPARTPATSRCPPTWPTPSARSTPLANPPTEPMRWRRSWMALAASCSGRVTLSMTSCLRGWYFSVRIP